MGETERHGLDIVGEEPGDEFGEVSANSTEEVASGRISDGCDREAGELGDGVGWKKKKGISMTQSSM